MEGKPPDVVLPSGDSLYDTDVLAKFMSPLPHHGSVPGTSMADFDVLEELGRGSHGVVFKVRSLLDGKVYVLKNVSLLHLNERQRQRAVSEVLMLRRLHHPHIIQYYHWFVSKDTLHLVMEFAERGDLYTLTAKHAETRSHLSEVTVWSFFWQLCQALRYLHANHVMHRDLKSMNVFVTRGNQLKVGDLGVSRIVQGDDLLRTRVGTPLYLAPELIQKKPYSFKVDVWALGCIVYQLACLRPPFRASNLITLAQEIVYKRPQSLPRMYSKALSSAVFRMLEKSPSRRPTVDELVTMFPPSLLSKFKAAGAGAVPKFDPINVNNLPAHALTVAQALSGRSAATLSYGRVPDMRSHTPSPPAIVQRRLPEQRPPSPNIASQPAAVAAGPPPVRPAPRQPPSSSPLVAPRSIPAARSRRRRSSVTVSALASALDDVRQDRGDVPWMDSAPPAGMATSSQPSVVSPLSAFPSFSLHSLPSVVPSLNEMSPPEPRRRVTPVPEVPEGSDVGSSSDVPPYVDLRKPAPARSKARPLSAPAARRRASAGVKRAGVSDLLAWVKTDKQPAATPIHVQTASAKPVPRPLLRVPDPKPPPATPAKPEPAQQLPLPSAAGSSGRLFTGVRVLRHHQLPATAVPITSHHASKAGQRRRPQSARPGRSASAVVVRQYQPPKQFSRGPVPHSH